MGVPLAALSIRPPEQQDTLQQFGRALAIKGAMQNQQRGQVELQQQQIALQQQMQDQQAAQAAMKQWQPNAQGQLDQNDFLDLMRKNNATPQTILKLQQAQLDREEKASTTRKNNAAAAADQAKLASEKMQKVSGDIDTLKALPPEQYQSELMKLLQNRIQDGTFTAQEAAGYAQIPQAHLEDLQKHILGEKAFHENQKTLAEQDMYTQRAALAKSQAAKGTQPTEASLAVQAVTPGPQQGQAEAALKRLDLSKQQARAPKDTSAAETSRSDKSYQFNTAQLDKVGQPIEQAIMRFGRLQDTVNQATPQADALIAPELLTVMAGGAGSGLRMNEAEISRIVGGRSNFESLKAALNKWQLDPSKALSITPAQRGQIRQLMGEVYGKLQQKQDVLDKAREDLVNESDPIEHRKIVTGARLKLSQIDMGQGGSAKPSTTGRPPLSSFEH
jgi:hypothetical protein